MMILQHILDIMPEGSLSSIRNSLRNDIWFYVKWLCFAIAAVIGLVAALRVYNLWQINGRHHIHIDSQVISWVAAAVFLMIATAFISKVLL